MAFSEVNRKLEKLLKQQIAVFSGSLEDQLHMIDYMNAGVKVKKVGFVL